ncbi:MAG: ribosome assembly factor SBDS [Nanoarchaeota archaeon]
MVSLEDAVIARIIKNKIQFEILVDPEKAMDFKKGKNISIENILAISEIFKDAKKGERASIEELNNTFNTTDIFKIATAILKHGHIQVTTEHRRKEVEKKKKEIADIISKNAVDPKTKLPHPVNRIMNAMEEAHVNINPEKPSRDQIENVVEKIRTILPISIERIEIAVRVPIQYAGKVSSAIRSIAPVKSEEWKSDSWTAVIEIPEGMQSSIYDKLNEMTSGNVEVKILKGK